MPGQFGGDSVDRLAKIEELWDPDDNSLEAQDIRWLIGEVKRLRRENARAELLAALHDILDNCTNRSLGAIEANRHNAEIARRAIAKGEGGGGVVTRAYVITRVVLRACILCGEQEWDAAGRTQRELTEVEAVADRNARCARCGGSLVGESESRRVRLEPEIDWYADRPRRGRPPKALRAIS